MTMPVPGEELVVGLHQVALTDGGEHRSRGDVALRPCAAFQLLAPGGNRARRHEDDLRPFLVETRHLADQRRHHRQVELFAARRQQVRPQLRHDAPVAQPVRGGALLACCHAAFLSESQVWPNYNPASGGPQGTARPRPLTALQAEAMIAPSSKHSEASQELR